MTVKNCAHQWFSISCGVALFFGLCSPSAAQVDPYSLSAPTSEYLSRPIGSEQVAAAGDELISTVRGRRTAGARLLSPVLQPDRVAVNVQMATGTLLYSIPTSRAFKACTVTLTSEGWPSCVIDDDGDGTFDRVARNDVAKAVPLQQKAAYERVADVVVPPAASGFKRVLLFQGGSADTLRFSYREFSNDFARPAFEEQLTIPLSGSFPQKFAIKGLIFTAIKMDSLGLQTRLESADPAKGWPSAN